MTRTQSRAVPDIAHVGYHRTGTNFLQKQVFPELTQHVFRPRSSGWHFFDDPKTFDEAGVRAYYEAEQRLNSAGRLFLISHERLTGTVERDDLSVPEKLHRLNPSMKIIVVLRAQPDIFRSLYHLHVKRGGGDRYADFVRRLATGRRCDYLKMVSRFHALFGRERVLTLLYEDLTEAPQAFLDSLCRFIGATEIAIPSGKSVNVRKSDTALLLQRFMNAGGVPAHEGTGWATRLRHVGLALAEKADVISTGIRGEGIVSIDADAEFAFIRQHYGESNRRLAAMIDRPLGELGYPL